MSCKAPCAQVLHTAAGAVARWVPGGSTALLASPNSILVLYQIYLWHGWTAASWSLLARPALGAAQWQSKGNRGAAGPGPGQVAGRRWLIPPLPPTWPHCVSLLFPPRQDMVWPSNGHRRLGIVAKKRALKWQFAASVILGTMGMLTKMNWRFRRDMDLPGQRIYTNAAHCPWQVGFHQQTEAAVRRDQPLFRLPKTGLQTFADPGSLRPSFSSDSSSVNASSYPLSQWH